MATITLPNKPSFLARKLALGVTPAHIFLVGIMLLSLLLHFSNLEAIGEANTYYTAAVESMLDSRSNFFFVAAEPGGSVTVDKPPLGLWIEAAFAFVLGVEGWAVSLPNILAGVFSVPVLYYLVRKYMGELAGLVAALALVVTPVAIAADRNNTMDGMLVFTLLLAAWAFIAATETGKTRWLLLGAFIVGLGFNIKMLQAFLPLPAFYALYLLGSKTGWFRKIFNLGMATVILLLVSISWAVIVDLTPPDRRPYIGSSEDNTVMELILGHNGLSRLFNPRATNAPAQNAGSPGVGAPAVNPGAQTLRPAQSPPREALAACAGQAPGAPCSFNLQNGNLISGSCILPLASDQLACVPQGRLPQNGGMPPAAPDGQDGGTPAGTRPGFNPPAGALGDGPNASPNINPDNPQSAGGTPFSQETGSPGVARFYVYPLSKQMSWLLPFALISLVLMVFAVRVRIPLEPEHEALVLWGGWLLTCLVFFSMVEGIFHAYYVIMLAPALGAVVGMGVAQIRRWGANHPWVHALLLLAAGITILFQIFTAGQYGLGSAWIYLPLLLLLGGAGLMVVMALRPAATLTVLVAMLLIPLAWTALTVLDKTPEVNLPTAYGGGGARQAAPRLAPELNEENPADESLVAFLQASTQDVEYLVAVPNAHTGAPLVLATGRPVLYMGGFSGGDAVIDAAGLAGMVADGELRYVLYGGGSGKQGIARWLASSCTLVPEFSRGEVTPAGAQPPDGPGGAARPDGNQPTVLYHCG
jgi:4-amino-4-deoxy-L-arabinose transferase-like glycosyltransferase